MVPRPGIKILRLELFDEEGERLLHRDAIPRYQEVDDSLYYRLQECLHRSERLPRFIVMGASYAQLCKFEDFIIVATCAWDSNLFNYESEMEAFSLHLAYTIKFFAGTEVKLKEQFLSAILDMSIKGWTLNIDALEIDFIRRAIPPSLRSHCTPHDPRLKVLVEESYTYIGTNGGDSLGKSLLATNVFINNPITTLKASLEYPDATLSISPNIKLAAVPCGYYPLAEARVVGDHVPISLTCRKTDKSVFYLRNELDRDLRDVQVKIDMSTGINYMEKCHRSPNNLNHRVTLNKGKLLWSIVCLPAKAEFSFFAIFKHKMQSTSDSEGFTFTYTQAYLIKLTLSSFRIDCTTSTSASSDESILPLKAAFVHPKGTPLTPIMDYKIALYVESRLNCMK